jgi:membrane-bound acyltransferase YfiQ involved in biofilm formation
VRIFRWIAFIPAGILAAVIATFPIHWLVMLIASNEENLLNLLSSRTLETLIIAFTTPFLIIFVGSWTAPAHRFVAAITLSIIIALILGGVYVFAFSGNPILNGWNSLYYGATPVLNLLGIASALYTVNRKWQASQISAHIGDPQV